MLIKLVYLRTVNVVVVVIKSSFVETAFMEIALISTTCVRISICINIGNRSSTMICTHIQIIIVIANMIILRNIIVIIVVIGVVDGISIIVLVVILNI